MVDRYSASAKKKSNSKKPTNTTRKAVGTEQTTFINEAEIQALDTIVDKESKELNYQLSELRDRELTMAMNSPTMVRFEAGM